MSNYNTTLQNNNSSLEEIITKINELPEAGEGVTDETTAYTTKLAVLDSAITALETELEGKASGGSGGSVETCTVTISYGSSNSDRAGTVGSVGYTAYENGNISARYAKYYEAGQQTITNVVKNSMLVWGYPANGECTNATFLNGYTSRWCYSIDGDAVLHHYTCLIYGTKILLTNGTTKEVQDITYDDNLLVWDFDNGCYASAKPLWIKKTETATYYYRCIFENETVLDLVGSNGNCHAVFCLDDNKFEYANKCVGKTIMTKKGPTKLLSCDKIEDSVEFYNIITDYHMNLFANNILTSTTMNNIYPIENMKFVKENRESIPYEAFSETPIEFYKGLRLDENKLEDIDKLDNKVKMILSKMLIASKEVNTNV